MPGGPYRRCLGRSGLHLGRGPEVGRLPHGARRADVARGHPDRRFDTDAFRGAAVHRKADRAGIDFRRPGGTRDRVDEIQDKNRQLQQASENKSQFVSSMSHELRTPLNAIIGLTEMMVKNAARFGTERAQEPLQRVNRAGTHLLGLINQVLDLSKIEAGKLELNPQTVQQAPLINDVISTAGQLAEQNKNRLVVDAEENLGALTVDPMRLRQILLNLLSNACKFTKEGEVKLAAHKVSNGSHFVE